MLFDYRPRYVLSDAPGGISMHILRSLYILGGFTSSGGLASVSHRGLAVELDLVHVVLATR